MFKKFPFYPILFSVFPVLSLAAHNIREISFDVVYRPLILSFFFCAVIFGVMWLFLRDWPRSALAVSIVFFLFFSYGQIYNALEGFTISNVFIFRHRTLLPLFGLLMVAGLFWIVGKNKHPAKFTLWLNILCVYLLIYPIFTIAWHFFQQQEADRSVSALSSYSTVNTDQPDIYYIILDAYGREDVLLNKLGYDNSEFINSLTGRGFYVANCSQSNYAYTQFSLPSSLNYDYLENINAIRDSYRVALLRHGAVRSFLEANDYKVVAFPTGWDYTEWHDADLYLDYERPVIFATEFEELVLDTTVIHAVLDLSTAKQKNISPKTTDRSNETLRQLRVLSVLSNLKKMPALDGKLFVFAHIVVPHPPYSFGPNGEWIEVKEQDATYEETRMAYINQVKFINRAIMDVIETILSESKTPPVIIVQGDHGPPPELSPTYLEKMPILNAYYLPGIPTKNVLYPSISPVNSFRVILNSYFDQNLPLLEDHSYYSDNNNYEYHLVPNSCPGNL
jgi:hypothetical protein